MRPRCSQPSSGSPLQSSQLYWHWSITQVPLEQWAASTKGRLVQFTQVGPQWLASVAVFAHTPPHAVVPAGHAQVPLLHVAVTGHAVVHDPQWPRSLDRVTQAPLQLVWPEGHCEVQVPFAHTSPDAQTVPHDPQFWGLLARLTQAPAHTVCPAGHCVVQWPPTHACPDEHAVPQAPQCVGLLTRETQAPEHSASPEGQVQTPFTQL